MRLLYYPAGCLVLYLVVSHALTADSYYAALAARQDLNGSYELRWAMLLERLSLGLYDGARDLAAGRDMLARAARDHERATALWSIGFIVLTVAYLLYRHVRNRRWRDGMLDAAILCLLAGLAAPLLTLTAHAELPILGEVVVAYQSKSIITTITSLYGSANYVVASAVLVFSVLVPVVKLVLLGLVRAPVPVSLAARSRTILDAVGKWSMADVFIVAMLVAIFALRADPALDATIGPGLFYFLAYCLLALNVSYKL